MTRSRDVLDAAESKIRAKSRSLVSWVVTSVRVSSICARDGQGNPTRSGDGNGESSHVKCKGHVMSVSFSVREAGRLRDCRK